MQYQIEPAKIQDFMAIYVYGKPIFETTFQKKWSLSEVLYFLEMDSGFSFVCIKEGEICGFCLAASHFDSNKDFGHLKWLAANDNSPELLQQLITHATAIMEKHSKQFVVIDEDENKPDTFHTFEKAGFSHATSVNFWIKPMELV